jgi:hypothetical protein
MLEKLSEQIRDCYAHATECARKAAAQTDQQLMQDFLDMERPWLALAKSYELSQHLGDFTDEADRRARRVPNLTRGKAPDREWAFPHTCSVRNRARRFASSSRKLTS